MRNLLLVTLTACLSSTAAFAQLSPQQKVDDFRSLVALYAKQYGPYEWKRDAFGYDLLDIKPWLDRIGRTTDDISYYEVLVEYVASLHDSHDLFTLPSLFIARLGFSCDIYDGKPVIDVMDRTLLPAARYPFGIGDEVVSIDGKPADQIIEELSKFNNNAQPGARRRAVAAWLGTRQQALLPRAHEVGDAAMVVIRRASGDLESYSIPWSKTGTPLTAVGPVIDPKTRIVRVAFQASSPGQDFSDWPAYMRPLLAMGDVSVPPQAVIGSGQRNPLFTLPTGFRQRQGTRATDNFYSGTFTTAEGRNIGYIRIPRMTPLDGSQAGTNAAYQEFATEIVFFSQNTDGLIVDVMRNPGGSVSYVETLCQMLINYPFRTLGFELRATQTWLLQLQQAVQSLRAQNAPDWIIALFESYGRAVDEANREKRGRTGPLPLGGNPSLDIAPLPFAYAKPLIVLADEFSASGGDMLPAIIQDNARGPIVGMRSNGAGGNVVADSAGAYSEGQARITQSLMNRKNPVVTEDLPTAPYVENIGVRPDIRLDIMTRENLMNGNRPFAAEVVRVISEEIARRR
ncbi:MAG: S41 family peptidase [Bryobacteraceae bacterium]